MKRTANLLFSLALAVSVLNAPVTVRAEEAETDEIILEENEQSDLTDEIELEETVQEETEEEALEQTEDSETELDVNAEETQDEQTETVIEEEQESVDSDNIPDHPESYETPELPAENEPGQEITHAEATAVFEEPAYGRVLKHPENLATETNDQYMSPADYEEETGAALTDTNGKITFGTIDNPQWVYELSDYVLSNSPEEFYFEFTLYAKQGYSFSEDTEVYFNDRKADRVTPSDDQSAAQVYVQYRLSCDNDYEEPELISLELETPEVNAGDTVKISARATDADSGIDYLDIGFSNERGKSIYLSLYNRYWDYDSNKYIEYEPGEFRGETRLDEYAYGTYKIDYVDIVDVAGNERRYYGTHSGPDNKLPGKYRDLSFVVNNDNPDTEPPVINSVSLSGDSIINGIDDSVELTVDASDDQSGISRIAVNFATIDQSHNFYTTLYKDNDNLRYTFKADEYSHWHDGEYYITFIDGIDKAGNSVTMNWIKRGGEAELSEEMKKVKLTLTGFNPAGEWKTDSKGTWYRFSDGSYPRYGVAVIDGTAYIFDNDGYLYHGWFWKGDKKLYSDSKGVMQRSKWVDDCYLLESGAMATSAWVDDGKYYVDSNGKWVKNAVKGEATEILPGDTTWYWITVGETKKMEYNILPSDVPKESAEVAWYSSDPDIASIDSDGNVTAHSSGYVRIVGELPTGSRIIMEVNVIERLQNLKFREDAEYRLSDEMIHSNSWSASHFVDCVPEKANGAKLEITSSNPDVIAVTDSKESIYPVGVGKTTITVTAPDYPGLSVSHEFEVYESVMPETMTFSGIWNEMFVGYDYMEVTAEYGPQDAKERTIWSSSDSSVVSVSTFSRNPSVRPQALKAGTATITATSAANPDLSRSFTVKVKEGDPAPGTFKTKVTISEYDEFFETGKNYKTDLDVFELEVGKSYYVTIMCESTQCVPSYKTLMPIAEDFIKNNSFIEPANLPGGFGYAYGPGIIMSGIPMAIKVVGKGSGSMTVGDTTFTFTVGVEGSWKSNSRGWWYSRADGTYPKAQFEVIDGKTYYFDNDGYMVTGWKQINGEYYFFESSGAMKKSAWEGSYYLKADGKMAKSEWIDNNKYYVGTDGKWIKDYGVPHWASNSKGWWYEDGYGGYAKSEFRDINDKTYYFGADGYMITGWKLIEDEYYFFESSGAMKKSAWEGSYYLKADGKMAKNEWVDNNKYYVGADGKWIKDYGVPHWANNSKGWWYEDGYGGYAKSEFKDINGKTYYFGADGYMVTGWKQIDGEYYFFESSGAMKKSAWEGNYYLKADGKMAKSEWVDGGRYYVDENGLWDRDKKQP